VHPVSRKLFYALIALCWLVRGLAFAEEDGAAPQPSPPPLEVLISIDDQRLVVLKDGGLIAKYKISTSRFGAGDAYGSYKTPLGKLKVCDKIGGDLASGSVIKHRSATGEVIPVNAPGRDPIVTRVIWLEGLEDQNHNARARGIYIHGTPEESTLGKPVSWGCIRMASEDVINVFEQLPVGTTVTILADRLPRLHKYKAPPPPTPTPEPTAIIVKSTPTPAPAAKQTPAIASAKPSEGPSSSGSHWFPFLSSSKQAAEAATPAPAPVAKTNAAVAKASPTPGRHIPDIAEDVETYHAADSEREKNQPANPDAVRAMKGSILLAGFSGAPSPNAAAKASPAPSPASKMASADKAPQ
jgi:hypothetical protein